MPKFLYRFLTRIFPGRQPDAYNVDPADPDVQAQIARVQQLARIVYRPVPLLRQHQPARQSWN